VVIDPSSSDQPVPEDENPISEVKNEENEEKDTSRGNNSTTVGSIDSKQIAVDNHDVCMSNESRNPMANEVNNSQAQYLHPPIFSQSMDFGNQTATPIDKPCLDLIFLTSKTPRHTITSPTMTEESIKPAISSSSCSLSIPPPETRRSFRNHRTPVQDDDLRYQYSAYQQKHVKSASKMARGKMLNEETS